MGTGNKDREDVRASDSDHGTCPNALKTGSVVALDSRAKEVTMPTRGMNFYHR